MGFTFSETFSIQGRRVGKGCPVFIVAEAGVSHFGNLAKARRLVDLAVEAGADAVKFQVYRTGELISAESGEWIERYQSKELPSVAFGDIQAYCNEKGIIFFATAHDEPSLELLDTLDIPVYKIGSGEVDNWSFIEKVAARKKPLILSTGMYTLKKVGTALSIIAKVRNPNVAVLHCVTSYPAPPGQVNLRAMDTIRETHGVVTGYSDHTTGLHFPLAAVAREASIIEKHITLDFDVPNAQDWKVSCGPEDFPIMVRQIRDIEAGLGSGVKVPGKAELVNLRWARKSLVAAVDIPKGQFVTYDKLSAKRPGVGIAPSEIEKIVGKRAAVKIKTNTLVKWEHLC